MINLFGPEPRSTYHDTCVRRVRKYLEKKCGQARSEEQVVTGHITDAYGFNKKLKIIYLCEVKVRRSDLRRAPNQIYETALRFKKKRRDYSVVPVIAVPARLQTFLVKQDNWEPLCLMCRNLGIAIWLIEQSTIREVQSLKINKSKNIKSSRTYTIKKKPTRNKKAAYKMRKNKKRKTQAIKNRTTQKTNIRVKKAVGKTLKAKRPKTKRTKRETSKTRKTKTSRKS
jgi:hypothetical protein